MNRRIAKKIWARMSWAQLYYPDRFVYNKRQVSRALRRLHKSRRNSPDGVVEKDTLRLVRYIIADRENIPGIQNQWAVLREQVIQLFNGRPDKEDQWNQSDYDEALERWVPYVPAEGEDPCWLDPTLRLEYALSKCSDRWCAWRVAKIDRDIQQIVELHEGQTPG